MASFIKYVIFQNLNLSTFYLVHDNGKKLNRINDIFDTTTLDILLFDIFNKDDMF